jgi:ParB family chromosome partitioning protein
VLQPILVRRDPGHPAAFEIVAGERRWRAAQMAGLHEVPVVIRELSDRDALAIGLVENLQRQDLTPLDEADGYRRLVEEFGNTQEDVARSVGKSRSHVANSLRLLTLSEPVKAMLANGALTAGHARPLIGVAGAEALARVIVQRGLNVRQTERLVAQYARGGVRPRPAPAVDANTRALERDLGLLLGVAVDIRPKGKGGALILHYRSLDQLDDILQRLSQGLRGRSLSAEPIADGD